MLYFRLFIVEYVDVKAPNIFDYATSELSQDAFICYLLEFGKDKYKDSFSCEYEIAHHFLKKCGIPFEEKIIEIKKQYKNIDIMVITPSYLLVIEDKTGTKEHSDQIVRYVKKLKEDSILSSNRKIKVCYLKTMDYVRDYVSSDKNILPQKDCCSLRREDMLNLLEDKRICNFIFDSFYCRLNEVEQRIKQCDDNDIKSWVPEKWFNYLYGNLIEHQFNIDWVSNPRGGFYACYFDCSNCGNGEKYKQIEISFKNDITSQVKLCLKFASNSLEDTLNSKSLIKHLQNIAKKQDFNFANRMGRTTTYAYKIANNKQDILSFIDVDF